MSAKHACLTPSHIEELILVPYNLLKKPAGRTSEKIVGQRPYQNR